ncbi:MAG: hypothetical protein VZR08_02175 [Anaerovoracaceae bacterium]|nr:hypothetical protein [Anaerovoracaceae bacterium]
MDIKDVLREIRSSRFEARELEVHRKRLEEMRLATGIRYDKDRITSSKADKLAELTAEIDEISDTILTHSIEMLQQEKECIEAINKVKESKHRRILLMRYIDDEPKTWEKIAKIMNYSVDDVKHEHGDAIEELRGILKQKKKRTLYNTK